MFNVVKLSRNNQKIALCIFCEVHFCKLPVRDESREFDVGHENEVLILDYCARVD